MIAIVSLLACGTLAAYFSLLDFMILRTLCNSSIYLAPIWLGAAPCTAPWLHAERAFAKVSDIFEVSNIFEVCDVVGVYPESRLWDAGMEFGDVGCVRISFAINSNPFPTHSQ